MVREAPEGSYLRAVLEASKANSDDGQLCTFTQDADSFLKRDMYQTLLLMTELNIFAAGFMMSDLAQDGKTFFYIGHKFFRLGLVQYYRRDIDEEFLKLPILEFQFGFQEMIQNKMKSLLRVFEFRTPTFYSKQQYVDSFSDKQQNNLNLDFFRDTFTGFLVALSLIIILFVICWLIKLFNTRMAFERKKKKKTNFCAITGQLL